MVLAGGEQLKQNFEQWVLDSGCSYHICPHKHWFVTYEKNFGGNILRVTILLVTLSVFLRVTLWTGVGRALKSQKLTPRFIGPFQILKRVGPVAYQIALPPSLSNLHNVFHVSQLHKYIHDPSHVIEWDDVQVKEKFDI